MRYLCTMKFLVGIGLALVASACTGGSGDGGGGSGDWDAVVASFAASTCDLESECFSGDRAACIADVEADMADAEVALGVSGQPACIACMNVKRAEGAKILAASCDLSAGDLDAVIAACDLDPGTDFNGDGDNTNDDDEACAGFP